MITRTKQVEKKLLKTNNTTQMNATTKNHMEKPTQPFSAIQYPFGQGMPGDAMLKTNWQQKWRQVAKNTVSDQYGFTIDFNPDDENANLPPYTLQWKGTPVATVYKITTAKLMSCILMNDTLTHKPIQNESSQHSN